MSRVFAYCRVSKDGQQTTEHQIGEIANAGFAIEGKRVVAEGISGSVAASERPGFIKLLDRLEPGDVLVVTKLDRLGRNTMDLRATVEKLAASGVRVHCLQLGGMDLTSPAGKMTMGVIGAVAEFERDLLIERTQAGLATARKKGKRFGRPPALSKEERELALGMLEAGVSISEVARDMGTSRQTILRAKAAVPA